MNVRHTYGTHGRPHVYFPGPESLDLSSKDFWGKPHQEGHRGIAKRLLAKVERDEVRLPLSFLHLIELLRKGEHSARRRLAEVFELYSRG